MQKSRTQLKVHNSRGSELRPRFQLTCSSISLYLSDPEPDVRIAASHAVSRFRAGIAIPSLEKAIAAEKDEGVRSLMQVDLQRVQAQKNQ